MSKAIFREHFEQIWNNKDAGGIERFIAPHYRGFDAAELISGIEGYKQHFVTITTAFPDLRITIEVILEEADRVAARWVVEATHTGPFGKIPPVEDMQLPAKLLREPDDFECYPTREDSRQYYQSWWQEHGPDWAVDRDRPPYHKSFLKVSVGSTGLRVQVFKVEDFGLPWIDAAPDPEWEIPYIEGRLPVSPVHEHSMTAAGAVK